MPWNIWNIWIFPSIVFHFFTSKNMFSELQKAPWTKQWYSKWMFGGNVGCNEKEWFHLGLRMSLHTYSGLFPGRQIINDSLLLPIQLCKHLFLPSRLFVCTGGGKVESENPFSSTSTFLELKFSHWSLRLKHCKNLSI